MIVDWSLTNWVCWNHFKLRNQNIQYSIGKFTWKQGRKFPDWQSTCDSSPVCSPPYYRQERSSTPAHPTGDWYFDTEVWRGRFLHKGKCRSTVCCQIQDQTQSSTLYEYLGIGWSITFSYSFGEGYDKRLDVNVKFYVSLAMLFQTRKSQPKFI